MDTSVVLDGYTKCARNAESSVSGSFTERVAEVALECNNYHQLP